MEINKKMERKGWIRKRERERERERESERELESFSIIWSRDLA